MNLTKLVLKRPVSTLLILLSLIVFGFSAFTSFPQELTPEMEMPMLLVSTIYPGASPEDVQELVTKPFEEATATLNGVKERNSYSMENMSMMLLQYEYGTDMDKAYNDLKKKLDTYVNTLPEETQTPVIMEMDVNAQASIMISVRGTADGGLLNYINEHIVPEMEKLSKVASVSVSGGQEEYISVELMDDRMRQYGLDINTVASCISSASFTLPAGDTDVGKQTLNVTAGMDYKTAAELQNIPIPLGNNNIIYLSDIAYVHDAAKEASSISRYNGEENITISITKAQSASAVDVYNDVNKLLTRLQASNPTLNMEIIYTASDMITSSLSSVQNTLLLGIVISMVILFLFFGDFKASLIVGSSIPISLLATFILMDIMGFSLNIISMSSLVIGVGMMVDNSIVVLESCFRSKTEGRGFKDAALIGARTVTSSIIASTVTTCVVFLPLALLKGMSGQLFQQLGFTIVFSMVASLLSAMTVVPLAFSYYRPVEREKALANKLLRKLEDKYEKTLRKILPHRKSVMLFSVVLLVVSVILALQLKSELIPNVDEGTVAFNIETKPGLKTDEIDNILRQVEAIVAVHPDTDYYTLSSGGSGVSLGDSSTLTVHLKSDRAHTTDEMISLWKKETAGILDCNIQLSSSSTTSAMTGATNTVSVQLQSIDYDDLKQASDQIMEAMKESGLVIKVHSSLENSAPLVKVDVDPIRAAAEGLTPVQVAATVNAIISGKEADTVQKNGQEISIMVEYPADQYRTIEQLRGITLVNSARKSIPLTDVADLVYKDSPAVITRTNNQYTVSITAEPTEAAGATAQASIDKMIADLEIPDSVVPAQSQLTETMLEEFNSLYGAIVTAIFLVFLVMAMQFESPRFSIMVMLCIPFSLIGSFGLLYLTDSTISMPSLLGFLMLVGTVVNNGILFVDTANQLKADMPVTEALVTAGKTRLRPILMTTLTTALSMIPMALGIGDGSEIMMGLAVVVIGGLLASTVLSLLMLPTFYLIITRKKAKTTIADKLSVS